ASPRSWRIQGRQRRYHYLHAPFLPFLLFSSFASFVLLRRPTLVMLFCFPQPFPDALDFFLRCLDTLPGFFLEGVQNVDSSSELCGVDCSVSVAIVVLNHFENSGSPIALERLGCDMLPALLSLVEGEAHHVLNLFRKPSEILLGASDPEERL